jgi:hypothetical protein
MGYDLVGARGSYRAGRAWGDILKIAHAWGWKPQGTLSRPMHPEHIDFERHSYFGNDWQLVTAEDAAEMAHAVRLAIADIAGKKRLNKIRRKATQAPWRRTAYLRHLREFADFAQQGEFMIG